MFGGVGIFELFFVVVMKQSLFNFWINKKIKLISKLEHINPDFLNHLKDIVIAYHTAKNSLQFSNKQKPADIFENVEIEWAKNLNVQQ